MKKKRLRIQDSLPHATAVIEASEPDGSQMAEQLPWLNNPATTTPIVVPPDMGDDDGAGLLGSRRQLKAARFEAEEQAAYEAELKARYAEIDALIATYISDAKAAEEALPVITSELMRDFEAFERYCAKERLPSLPADPRAVAIFLCDWADGLADAIRLRDSISIVHRRMKEPDPTLDLVVRALLRQIATDENENKPQQKELN